MIRQIPYYEHDLEVLNPVTGEIGPGFVIGYASDGARVIEKTRGYLPLFKHLKDPDGDWIEVKDETNDRGRELYDQNLLRYKC